MYIFRISFEAATSGTICCALEKRRLQYFISALPKDNYLELVLLNSIKQLPPIKSLGLSSAVAGNPHF
jgi:hypothetical protein